MHPVCSLIISDRFASSQGGILLGSRCSRFLSPSKIKSTFSVLVKEFAKTNELLIYSAPLGAFKTSKLADRFRSFKILSTTSFAALSSTTIVFSQK